MASKEERAGQIASRMRLRHRIVTCDSDVWHLCADGMAAARMSGATWCARGAVSSSRFIPCSFGLKSKVILPMWVELGDTLSQRLVCASSWYIFRREKWHPQATFHQSYKTDLRRVEDGASARRAGQQFHPTAGSAWSRHARRRRS